jgi:hypothetical protein
VHEEKQQSEGGEGLNYVDRLLKKKKIVPKIKRIKRIITFIKIFNRS